MPAFESTVVLSVALLILRIRRYYPLPGSNCSASASTDTSMTKPNSCTAELHRTGNADPTQDMSPMSPHTSIPGYDFDDHAFSPSAVSEDELGKLQASVLFGPGDRAALKTAGEVLGGQVEQILDVWYGFVGSHPHLHAYFSTPAGEPIKEYLDKVRPRFGRWIIDTCSRPYDGRWLAYQDEIALRHTRVKKNQTDQVDSVPFIPLRIPHCVHLPDHRDDPALSLPREGIQTSRLKQCSKPGSRL